MARRRGPDLEQPLRGAIICCTSLTHEQRSELADIVHELGGKFYLDLTADVTHLLVAQISTPKYKYVAREREDVKVIEPEFVFAVRDAWRSGEDFSLETLEDAHRLKTFSGSTICVTGFDDLTFRAQLQETIELHGGAYKGDLTKIVTHLIARAPEGKKYQYAQQWQIKTVSLKWLKESLERGLILEESLYHPTKPLEEQGKGAWNRKADEPGRLGKRSREPDVAAEAPRKLRRTASARLGSQNDALWGDIIGGGGFETESLNQDQLRQARSMSDMSVMVQQTKSFATDTTTTNRERSITENNEQPAPVEKGGFLVDCLVMIDGFNEKQSGILRDILSANGAELANDLQDLQRGHRRFVLVPFNSKPDFESETSGHQPHFEIVTDLWIERCLHSNAFIEPSDYVPSRNVQQFPLEGYNDLVINTTAFDGIEVLHISKLVSLLGAKYDEYFKPSVSVLISKTQRPSDEKLLHAYQWKIPVVSADWFWSCLRTGICQSYKPYLIKIPASIKAKVEKLAREAPAAHVAKQNISESRRGSDQRLEESRSSRTVPVKIPSDISHVSARPKSKPGADFAGGTASTMLLERKGNSTSPTPKSQTPTQEVAHFAPLDGLHDQAETELKPPDAQAHDATPLLDEAGEADLKHESINNAIQDLLRRKNPPNGNTTSTKNTQVKKKRLLGRALSNLSNSSREGTATKPSRASSIDSLNTDGVGSVILDENSQAGRSKADVQGATESGSRGLHEPLTGKATVTESMSIPASLEVGENPYYEEANGIEEPIPPMTQLGWDDPDEAKKLRELMVNKKKKGSNQSERANDTPQVERKIQDDDALLGTRWGGGRRTRTKTRSPKGVETIF